MHPEDKGQVEKLVDLFNGGFHSPMYTASRTEIRETGLPVTFANDELWNNVWGLVQLYQGTVYNDRPDPATPGAFYRYVCIIEFGGPLYWFAPEFHAGRRARARLANPLGDSHQRSRSWPQLRARRNVQQLNYEL